MRHVISILIENEAGALSRVVGLFSQRGYNIDGLTVAPTDDPTLSRCSILTTGDKWEAEQITGMDAIQVKNHLYMARQTIRKRLIALGYE